MLRIWLNRMFTPRLKDLPPYQAGKIACRDRHPFSACPFDHPQEKAEFAQGWDSRAIYEQVASCLGPAMDPDEPAAKIAPFVFALAFAVPFGLIMLLKILE